MTVGPIQLLLVGFVGGDFKGEILEELRYLREADVVRLVDLLFVKKNDRGEIERLDYSHLSGQELQEFGAYVGSLIGLGAGGEEGAELGARLGAEATEDAHWFDRADSWYVEDAIPDGAAAAVALIEHRWAIPLREAIRRAGGFSLADAWINRTDLIAVGLLAAEEAEAN